MPSKVANQMVPPRDSWNLYIAWQADPRIDNGTTPHTIEIKHLWLLIGFTTEQESEL